MLDTNKILQLIGVQGYKLRVNEHPEQLENTKGNWRWKIPQTALCIKAEHKQFLAAVTRILIGFLLVRHPEKMKILKESLLWEEQGGY